MHGHLVAQMGRLMKTCGELRGGLEESAAEQRAVLAAVDCGDADLAARLIAGQIEVPQRVLEDLVGRTIFEDEQPSNGEESSGLE